MQGKLYKLRSVFDALVVIDYEFLIALSNLDYFDNVMTKFIVSDRTDA